MDTINKKEILEEFQSLTGESDLGQCIAILESCNWNLEIAANLVLSSFDSETDGSASFISTATNSSSTTTTTTTKNESNSVSSKSFSSSSRELIFYVVHNDNLFRIPIKDCESVATLKSHTASVIGQDLSKSTIHFSQGPLIYADDNLLLSDFKLPEENTVSVDFVPKKSLHNQTNKYKISQFGDDDAEPPSDSTTTTTTSNLQSLTLTVKKKVDSPESSACNYETQPRPMTTADSPLSSVSCSGDESADEFSDDWYFESDDSIASKPQILMDPTVDDEIKNIDHFCSVFASRYVSTSTNAATTNTIIVTSPSSSSSSSLSVHPKHHHSHSQPEVPMLPPFYHATLSQISAQTLFLSPLQRRPLLIYLHKDNQLASHLFPTNVLCNSVFLEFIKKYELNIWPWDVTANLNYRKLLSALSSIISHSVSRTVANLSESTYPLLLLLVKKKGRPEIVQVIEGHNLVVDTVASQLTDALTEYQLHVSQLILEELNMQERERIREEQNQAYHETLLEDAKREEEKQMKIIQEAETMARFEETKRRRKTEAENALPNEPNSEIVGKNDIALLKFRLPHENGFETTTRRFHAENSLKHLLQYLESIEYFPENYKILTTYPRRDLSVITNQEISLRELKLVPQETIILEKL